MEILFSASRPNDGQVVEARFSDGVWRRATYWADEGIDGVIEDEDGDVTEIEEYEEMLWRPEGGAAAG